jgi:hypothetical protein
MQLLEHTSALWHAARRAGFEYLCSHPQLPPTAYGTGTSAFETRVAPLKLPLPQEWSGPCPVGGKMPVSDKRVYQAESPFIVNSQHCDAVVLGWTQMGVYF